MPLTPHSTLGWRVAIVGVFLLALLLAWTVWAVIAANSFSGRIAAIRAAGDPASIADLGPKSIPPEQNAAAHLAEVKPQIDAFARDHGQFFKTPVGKSYEDRKAGEPLTSDQLVAIKAVLDNYSELEATISTAMSCDAYASQLDYSVTHEKFSDQLIANQNRTVARFLKWKIDVALAEGRHANAAAHCLDALRLGRLMRSEPAVIGGLVANADTGQAVQLAYHALNASPASDEFHAALDQELARHDDPAFVWMMKSERALEISMLQQELGGIPGLLMNTLGRPMKLHHTAMLDLFEDVLKDAAKPWHVTVSQSPQSAILKSPTGLGVMPDLTQPSIAAAYESTQRALAVTRALRVFNALRRAETSNGTPASIDALDLPKDAITDPFSGESLKAIQSAGRWIIYSVGEDGKDDGGEAGKDYGVGLREEDED